MKLIFLGSGSAFTMKNRQSNMLFEINGRRLLLDAGTDVRHSLEQQNLSFTDVHEVYISHCHADHIGGLEWLAFCTLFTPGVPKPKLHISKDLEGPLWNNSLAGGMASLEGQIATLNTYFDVNAVPANQGFTFESVFFRIVQTIHVLDGFRFSPSYGLLFNRNGKQVYITTDTQFCPHQIMKFYSESDIIFQDCETMGWDNDNRKALFKSGVHAHYADLLTLPVEIKEKMWLYHYNDGPLPDAVADGFKGFVQKGQVFEY